ncbi:hypothetical protein EJM72_07400 [Clostridium botulinum]|uniref:phage tail protein n=2 Tax=Clostridium botulinum TaxID=1491 RepID=UPI0013756B27|nr:phage tail protein [Clostridium botulinum]NCI19876.1 hypothetical protein [Clostridium botulinum]NCI71771.1 hypothetical protein [Clostridium botulinum]NDI38687.1 hypothetical protein [Clostridium botulinum]
MVKNQFEGYGIDKSLKPPKIKMTLYKNKNEAISRIKDFYDVSNKITLGNTNELSFNIPFEIEKKNKLVENPMWNSLKYRYYILFEYNNIKEWYIISNLSKDSANKSKQIQAKSLQYLLRGTKLYNYEAVSYTVQEVLNGNQLDNKRGILYNTTWSLGHIDETLKTKKRGITMTGETSVLDAIYTLAEKFNAILQWDTENEIISFYDDETYGEDNGLLIQYNKYLENIKEEENPDELCTILKVQGKDSAEISSINPTGKTYLTNYSFFMYPFEVDKDNNIIKHSNYMSDNLCLALLNFDKKINENKGKLQELITKKYVYDNAISQKEMQLIDLHGEYDAILKKLAISQSTNSQKETILDEKAKKFEQIQQREKDIKFVKQQRQVIETQIDSIKFILSENNNFTPSEIEELKNFREEKTYVNNNINDEKELFLSANEYFQKLIRPKRVITLSMIDFLRVVEAQRDWDKLKVGDVITVNYYKFGIDKMKAKIVELDITHENMMINITIANVNDIDDDEKRLSKLLYNASSTSAIIDETPSKLNTLKDTINNIDEIINNTWKASQRQIYAGTNNTTIVNQLGLTSMESENKKRGLRINNGALMCTAEGENFFKTIINGDGIIDIGNIQGKIDKDTDIKVDIDNIETGDGEKITDLIDDKMNELKTETDKAVEDLTNRADQQIERADELADYIDGLTGEIGVFKVETEKALATKVANTEFKSYRMQTAELIADKISSSEFKSYRTQTDRMIADKVSSNAFDSYRTQTDREIMDRVKSSEFNSYIYQTDKRISMVVDDYGNINAAQIAMGLEKDSSFIRMIADRIEIKPTSGVIEFPNGTDVDSRDYGDGRNIIRLRSNYNNYISVSSNGIALFNGSSGANGRPFMQFDEDAVYVHGKKVKWTYA